MARTIRDPQSRFHLVETAWRVIADTGIHAATMRSIAKEADVSLGYVTHYFEDKQQLLDAVMEHNHERSWGRVLAAVGSTPGLAGLTAAINALLPLDKDRRREWQVLGAFWSIAPSNPSAASAIESARSAMRRGFVMLLRQAVDDGGLPDDLDLTYEADRLLAVLAGLGLFAGVESPTRARTISSRMIADHVANLRRTNV